ncbi:dienelactone hydrolase family protein [Subtercola boreus]|uniref:Carboxymethylenebutenolidase n=1 Tax=Subtercola boreus TaxID=120213 RepID=A0A3E0WEF4_9MICO|nr:dienelactone hydrolase family protein [Subtercola boreus]RFA23618.1 carboxymethylenebutenolidase [Subtercola boreus]RFA24012.1 carboxymethylenebutenolidase [Subtercola boreus]RFA29710.1 carboxymethylenebutenolidase [Subtercola boreus]
MTAPDAPTVSDIDLTGQALPGMSPGLHGVLAVPAGEGPWPAVVMVHEAFGLTEVMRRQVERMAAAGFLVLMPDLFVDGGARKCLRATFQAISTGQGRAWVDVEAARAALVARADCTGRVGVLGFCMGGGFALVAAADRGFDAASVNYGRLPSDMDTALAGACPIVGSYGGRDNSLRGAAAKLDAELAKRDIPRDVKEYPTAGHSFLNDAPTGPAWMRPVMKAILGAGPEPIAAADAWARIDAFFHTHLAA